MMQIITPRQEIRALTSIYERSKMLRLGVAFGECEALQKPHLAQATGLSEQQLSEYANRVYKYWPYTAPVTSERTRWTDEEDALLMSLYQVELIEAIVPRFPNRTKGAIQRRAAILGVQRRVMGRKEKTLVNLRMGYGQPFNRPLSETSNPLINLTGKTFGDLTIGKRAPNQRYESYTLTRWHYTCTCGNTGIVEAVRLKENHRFVKRSCGGSLGNHRQFKQAA